VHEFKDLNDTEEAAEFLPPPPATLRFWRYKGVGPKYFKVGGHKIFHRKEDLEAYLETQYQAYNPSARSA
jgi:hypothetical protein